MWKNLVAKAGKRNITFVVEKRDSDYEVEANLVEVTDEAVVFPYEDAGGVVWLPFNRILRAIVTNPAEE